MRSIITGFLIVILLSSVSVPGLIQNNYFLNQAMAQASIDDVSDIGSYVVLGLEEVEIKKDSIIHSGNIGVNNIDSEIKLEKNVLMNELDSFVAGDTIKIEKNTVIQNVFFNELENKGTIVGTQNTPLIFPVIETFPNIPDSAPGTESINVPKDQSQTLPSGQYDKIMVDEDATLIFEGGMYTASSVEIKKNAKIFFEEPSEFVIENELKLDKETILGPSETSSISASDIAIFVGSATNPTEETSVDFDKYAIIDANIFAPNGEISMDKGVHATGSFVANKVKVDKDSTLVLDSQLGIIVLIEELEETLEELDSLFVLIEHDSDAEIFEDVTEKIEKIRLTIAELESSGVTVEVKAVESSPLKLIIELIKNSNPIVSKSILVLKTVCGITAVSGVSEYYTDILGIPDLPGNHEKNALAIIIANVCENAPQDAFDSSPESIPQVARFLESIGEYLIGKGSPFDVANVLNQPYIRMQLIDVADDLITIYSLFLDQVMLVESVIANISAMIMGIVFDDKNANQVQDGSEGSLSNWEITLTDLETSNVLGTAITDVNGQYLFSTAFTAFTEVRAEIRPDTEQTLPDPNGPTGGTYHVNIMSKSFPGETTVLDFGNRQVLPPTPSDATEIQRISDSGIPTTTDDQFGRSVSISGNTAIVGAPNYETPFLPSQSGIVYVFTKSGNTWVEQAKIENPDPEKNDGFGHSVSISGDTALIGTHFGDKAYVFVRDGNTWTQQAKFTNPITGNFNFFGQSVALQDDTAVVGDPSYPAADVRSGAVYIFTRSGTTWTQQAQLTTDDAADHDRFGHAVSIFW